MNDETTGKPASESNEPIEQQESHQAAEPQPEMIPEKFVGKSIGEIGKSYAELERSFHKISSERSEEQKARRDLETKLQALEERLNARQAEVPRPPVVEEEDPLAEYDEEFESNPKEAIKKTLKKVQEKALTAAQRAQLEMEAKAASDYYHSQKKDNPEFSKLEGRMTALAQEFGDLVSPSKANSVKAIRLLHLAARGAELDSFVKEAVDRAKKEGATIRQEKKQAFSEGTSTESGAGSKKFSELSLDEMEKLLGRADK